MPARKDKHGINLTDEKIATAGDLPNQAQDALQQYERIIRDLEKLVGFELTGEDIDEQIIEGVYGSAHVYKFLHDHMSEVGTENPHAIKERLKELVGA